MQSELLEERGSGDADGFGLPRIVVVGCGGAGSNTVSRLSGMGLERAWTVAVNTDSQHLTATRADEKILIGSKLTRGMGAGGDPEVGRRAAEMASAHAVRRVVRFGRRGGTSTRD